jgi:hypothetical protein
MVAHTYNPSYLGDLDGEDHSSRSAQANKLMRPPSQQKKLGVVVCTCHPSYGGTPKIGESLSKRLKK